MNHNLLHTPEGVRDIYGTEYRRKLRLEELLHEKMRNFGYQDIQTPTIEFFDVFSKEIGTTPSKELYKFFDKEGNTLVLRPDFTPSMCRCAAKYFGEDDYPIRFCYTGNTFINSSNLRGKLKEVTQLGAELIGDGSIEADAEMIAMVILCLKNTGLTNFQVSIGEVDYFRGICESAGLDEDTELSLREYISEKNVFGVEDLLHECNLAKEYTEVFSKLPELFGSVAVLDEAGHLVNNSRSCEAVDRLKTLYFLLQEYGVEKYVSFDLGMLSQYHYYTGIIFKAYTYGIGDAIVKGGRYDNLLRRFGKDAPATGFVVVVDDLMTALSSQKIVIPVPVDEILVWYQKSAYQAALKRVMQLRIQNKNVEMLQLKNDQLEEEDRRFLQQRQFAKCLLITEKGEQEISQTEEGEKEEGSL